MTETGDSGSLKKRRSETRTMSSPLCSAENPQGIKKLLYGP